MSALSTSAPTMTENLRSQTVTGVSWSALTQIANQSFTLVISIVVARLLGPTAYGLIGMITVFTGFAAVFGDLGLGAALIQKRELEVRHLNGAFWANITVGSTMTILMGALAPVVAWFYKEPVLLAMTMTIALRFVVDSLNVVQIALLNRNMQFRTLAGIQIGSTIFAGCLGLGMAFCGLGAWSLIAQTLAASVMAVILSWRLTQWHPSWSFEKKACQELFGFGAYVLGFNVVNYWARNLDQLLIGRSAGAAALGVYSRAYSLMLMPLHQVSGVVGRVMFPALSSIQDDKPRVGRAYLRAIAMIGLITFPMMSGAFVVSDHLIPALLGQQWIGVIPIFKIFCWVGMMQSITTTVGWIYTSQGRTGLYFAMGTIAAAILAVAFVIAIHWGVMGMAWCYAGVNLLLWYPFWTVPGRLIGLTFFQMLRQLLPAFLCSVAMAAVVWCIGRALPAGMPHWQALAVQVSAGIVSYAALLAGLRVEAWESAKGTLLHLVRQRLQTQALKAARLRPGGN